MLDKIPALAPKTLREVFAPTVDRMMRSPVCPLRFHEHCVRDDMWKPGNLFHNESRIRTVQDILKTLDPANAVAAAFDVPVVCRIMFPSRVRCRAYDPVRRTGSGDPAQLSGG